MPCLVVVIEEYAALLLADRLTPCAPGPEDAAYAQGDHEIVDCLKPAAGLRYTLAKIGRPT